MKTIAKIILTACLLLITVQFADAQFLPVDETTKKVTYQEVVTQDGATPTKLYNQAIEWINSFYNNPSDATRVRDPDNGRIEVKHRIKVCNVDKNGNRTAECEVVSYEMSLEFKDGRYRYTITNFNVERTSRFPLERWLDKNDPQYTAVCDVYLQHLNEEVNKVIKSMKDGMKPKVIKEDNW
jgi:hypothetical protein